jgi:hypothetical protein
MKDVIDYLKHSIGAQTSSPSNLLHPLHFTNSSMQTKFPLPLNPNPESVEKQPNSSQQSPPSELSSNSPPLLEWLSRLCFNTLFMYMSFPKLGMLKGKPLYVLTPWFALETNAAVNGGKTQPLHHYYRETIFQDM